MAVRIPDMNPVRFRDVNKEPDYVNFWPTVYNMVEQTDYYPGIYSAKFLKDFVINEDLNLQFGIYSPLSQLLQVYKLNILKQWVLYANISPDDITPDGWVSETIYKYTWTPIEAGIYYISMPAEGIQSDYIKVHSDNKYKRNLFEIEYYNSYNDYGMIFDDNGTNVFTAKSYFEGRMLPGEVQNEISGYPSDRGKFVKTRSTPLNSGILKIFKTPMNYQHILNTIFSCDNIYINGIKWINEDSITMTQIEKSDLANYEINLKEVNITYSYK